MYILLGAVAFLAIIFIALYNGLVSIRNQCDEARSNVDTERKRRYDLIPNLVNTGKGYASHEKDLIEKVGEMREQAAGNTGALASQAQDEIQLQKALGQLMVRLENYPDLKASSKVPGPSASALPGFARRPT